jgi:probable F420-dependent oxidoreductase
LSGNPPRRAIRIAVQLQPIHARYQELALAVEEIDHSGADILFNSDHFFPSVGDSSGRNFEAWTLLAAWAALTQNVKLGVSVSASVYRNAHLLADMARTVDHISGGRAILGIGSGWFRKDYDEYGYVFPDAGERINELERALDAIRYRLAVLNPPPVQPQLPIMIGNGGDRKPPEMVARLADLWLDFRPLPDVAAYNAELDAACHAIGRDPAEIERGVCLPPDELDRIGDWLAAGCTLFMQRTLGPDFELPRLTDWLGWRDEVNDARSGRETPSSPA